MIDLTNAKSIGYHHFVELDLETYFKLLESPTNRNSKARVKKMKPIFDGAYANGQEHTLTEVAIGIVTKDFSDPDTGFLYKKGSEYIIDSNTRKHYWEAYPDLARKLEKPLTAKIHYLAKFQDVEFAYYPYNNAKSAEKKSDILHGLAKRYHWQPKQTVFANGGYGTALDWATEDPTLDKRDPNRKMDVFEAFHFTIDQLKVLDSTPKHGDFTITKPAMKCIKSQAIIAAFLVALRIHPNNLNLLGMIERLANITVQEVHTAGAHGDMDAVQIIAAEYSGYSKLRGTNGTEMSPWLDGYAGDTKFLSQQPQMDFLLYFIGQYITNPNKKLKFTRGVSPLWKGEWENFI